MQQQLKQKHVQVQEDLAMAHRRMQEESQALKETLEKTKEGLSTGGLKRSHLEMQDQLKKNHAKVQEGERANFLEYCSIYASNVSIERSTPPCDI
jgi:hypothetical protein